MCLYYVYCYISGRDIWYVWSGKGGESICTVYLYMYYVYYTIQVHVGSGRDIFRQYAKIATFAKMQSLRDQSPKKKFDSMQRQQVSPIHSSPERRIASSTHVLYVGTTPKGTPT